MLDGPFGNGEAQAVSALGPGTGFVHSIEALEDLLLMLRRDARPLVGNFNDGFPVAPGGTDGDVRLRRRVAHRIVNNVQQGLPEQQAVSGHDDDKSLGELMQRILHLNVQDGSQLIGEVSARGTVNESFRGGQ